MDLTIRPRIWQCVAGNVRTPDETVRSVLRLMRRSTGADLFSVKLDDLVSAGLSINRPVADLCRDVIADLYRNDQILPTGGVKAVLDPGAKEEPFHRVGWHKQGHTAVVALFAAVAGDMTLAESVVKYLLNQQVLRESLDDPQPIEPLRVGGLWCPGCRFAQDEWIGHWAWANDHSYLVEDGSQFWEMCVLDAFGYNDQVRDAYDALTESIDFNGAIPTCMSTRDTSPMSSRPTIVPSLSIDASTRYVMFQSAMGFETNEDLRQWVLSHEIATTGGTRYWPQYICPKTNRPIYSEGAAPTFKEVSHYRGRKTYQFDRAVRAYRGVTKLPAFIAAF